MKKIIISLFSLGFLLVPFQFSEANFFQDMGNAIVDGVIGGSGGLTDSDNDGVTDLNESINNWGAGISQDIVTDLFGNTGVGPIPDGQFALPCPEAFNGIANTTSLRQYVLNIVQWILSFLGLLAILMIIYAGFLYVTDGGDEDNVGKAKKIMLYSVIGILIIFAAYPLVNTVIGVASTGEDIDGAIAGSGGTTYITGSPDSQLSLEQQCQNQQFANSRPWFAWDWQDSNIDAIRNDIVVVPKGAPVKFKLKKSDLGSGKYTPEIKFVYWNFGDGNDWTVSSPKDSLEISKTYFEKGKYYASAVVEDKQGARHKLISQVIVGHVIEAKFSASTYFPASGQQVEFDASPTIAHFGDISEYEWETQEIGGTGTCPDMPDNTPRPSAKFFGEDLECRVSLKVYSDAKGANGENLTSSTYEEIIEVSLDPENNPDGAVPIPELNYIEVITDSSVTGADNLVLVKIEAWDQIDKPLENFKFEVFEDGQLVAFQASNYGVLVESGDPRPSGASAVPHDMHATYSEHLFDLSAFKGTHNYKFRATVTNSFGKKDRIDSDFHEVIVANGNIPPQGKAEVSPAIGTTQTEFVFNGEVTDADLSDDLFYRWVFPDGTKTAKTAVPGGNKIPDLTHTFETSGTKAMTLWFTDGVVEREVIKNVFVGNGVINSGPQVSGIDVLPSRNAPIGTIFSFYPRLFDVNGDSLDYEWNFNEEAQLDTLNAAHKFNTEGQKRVIFTVSDGEKETVQEIVVNVYDPNKKNDDIERASFPRILRVVAEPDVERVGTAMEFFAEVEDDDSAERDLKYKWEFGDNTRSSSEVSPTHSYTKKGFYVVNLTVTDKEGHESKSSIKVEVIGEDEDMPNRLPIIKTFNVLPKTYGKIDDSFTFYVKSYDPDESDGDFVEYSWYLNGVLLNGKNGKQIVLKNDSNSRDPQFIDGENIVKIVAKDQRDGLAEAEKTIFISPDGKEEKKKRVPTISRVLFDEDTGKVGIAGITDFKFDLEFLDKNGFVMSVSDVESKDFSYNWNFGDGTTSNESSVNHIYANKGSYNVNVSVDTGGKNDQKISFVVLVFNEGDELPNNDPIVSLLTVSPKSFGTPEDEFRLKALASDPDGNNDNLNYKWSLNGDILSGENDSTVLVKGRVNNSALHLGENVVTLLITDEDGGRTEVSRILQISKNGAGPDTYNGIRISRIILNPDAGRAGKNSENKCNTEFNFSVEFVDGDGVVLGVADTKDFKYKWNLGDGSALQTTEAVSGYCYAKKGNYRANVSVDISSGSKDSREFLVEVVGPDETMPNASPVIESVNVFPNLYGKPGETFEITVNAFDPNEADVLTYSWAVDGKTVEKNTNREEFIFEKSDRSYRKVAVTISDGEKSETIEKNFFITESGQQRKPDSRNAVPVIKRIIKEPGVIARVIDEGEKNKFIFTAEVEDDASDVLSYEWDFGDFSTATTSVATHSYEKPGNYVVKLSVTDTADHVVNTSFEIQVVGEHANLPNRVPIIKNINVLPKSFGKPNEPFTFVVDGFDPDKNDTIEFVWKHEGVTETGKTVSFTFVKEGYQTVVLEAKDSFGLTSTLEKTVYINKNGESSPSSTPERNTPPKIQHITNYPGGSVRLGEVSEFSPVVEDEDITTSKDDLKYKWDFGDGNTSSEKNVAHTFESAGTYLVKLKVTDSGDSVAEKFVSVRVFGPNETMPNRAPVISNVSILPKSYGKINENFTLKTVVRDPESDAITVEWKTIDDVLGTGNSIQTSFEENGLYQIYIEATDETNVASRMVTININPEGEKIETLDWDTQYLKWLEQVNHWKEEQAKLAAEKQRLLDRIANESNEEKRKELAKELAKVNDLLANAGENLKQAEQELNKLGNNDDSAENDAVADKQKTAKLVEKIQLELAAKKKALLEAIANEPNAEKRKILEAQLKNIEALIDQAETTLLSELQGAGETGATKRQIALLDNLIVDSENTLELLDFDVKTLQQDRADLLKKIAETDDPVERSKLLQTLFALDAEIAQIQQKQVFEASRLEKLKQEKSFLEKSLKSEDLGSRVEKQRDVQRIRRIIKQLFIRIKEVQNVLHELNSTQTEALRDFSTGSTLEDRTEKLPAIESRDKKILGKQKELLALEKTVAGMETQKQQKETQLYVSSVKTESAVQAKIETLQSDVRRIRQSLKAFYENLSIEQQENADLEQKLVLANSQTLRDSLRNEVQAVLNKIASIQAGIFEQESRIIYYEQNVANLEGQLLEIVGSGYEIGIKNKEELQLKLENTESQIAEAKALVIKTKEARVALAKKRDGLLGNLESEVNEAQKSAILEEVKTLDLELFALDKKLVPQENKLASLTRNVQSLKQDLFGSVNAFDLQSDIKNIVARKDFAKELADKFTKRITDQNQEKQALVAKISELGNADVMAVLFRELDNLAIYKQNIHQFELVFELGEVIQLESFVDTKVDLAEAKKAIATDEAEVLSKIFTQAVSADLKDEYVSIRTNLQDLHEKLREQVDLADLLEMKQALLEATIENDKVIFEQTLADTYKSVAAKKDEIDAAFSDRLELESDWREGRNKVVVIPKDRAKNVQKIEAIDESIVQKDLAIETLKADIFTRIVKIDAYSELLEKYFVIQGTTETKFFLYGRLPKDTTKALFVEWDTGDGRILYGQNINVQYAEPGKYSVKMNVTDGVNTSTDVLTIKVDSAS